MRLLPAVLIALAVAACAPARLERIAEKQRRAAVSPTDLHRALEGAQDAAAKRALGEWLAGAPRGESTVDGYTVRFHQGGEGIYAADYFDRLEPASRYKVTGLAHHQVDGIGIPLTGYRENRHRQAIERWYPPEAITRAVTAVAVRKGAREIEIRLHDRLKTESIMLAGKRQTLAGDFTVPWTAMLEHTRPLAQSGITAVIRKKSLRESGFALVEEYDPKRTPVICIHGLFSTPLAWAELTNELWADPAIRSRYQVWHYLYPTNAPALYSARIMRGQLDELRKHLDPEGDDPAMRRSVVIAHSNGGLLAKSLAVDPRDAFWDAVFTRPLSSLDLTHDERRTLDEAFYWKPRTHVDRVIFCSVPFRGSNWANSWLGRFGQRFVAQDDRFQDFFRGIEKKNPGMLQPDYESLTRGKVTSLIALSPKQRSMEIFDRLPLVKGTAGHVITGSRDLFVAPSSSSLPGAESSFEVPAGHGSFHHSQAIEEIKRILLLPEAR
ncbi:alpha/beta hydrolase [Luteolibacter flavescens]|uniref:Alpha/beta hydrolase n=1 Tax=Luteolibacter flavescens TaxID=1859460 RepID=A0ABT3FPZ4_9BACT|nr:alpha/beta hydrolase [Luteolibacter flavescens]MCW1885656.1 alpha/beta hydrolase [Luteolibacter flavescens]